MLNIINVYCILGELTFLNRKTQSIAEADGNVICLQVFNHKPKHWTSFKGMMPLDANF